MKEHETDGAAADEACCAQPVGEAAGLQWGPLRRYLLFIAAGLGIVTPFCSCSGGRWLLCTW